MRFIRRWGCSDEWYAKNLWQSFNMTVNAQSMDGCITRTINGTWLTNGHLEVCFLKLIAPIENHWTNDESRSENVDIVKSLLYSSATSVKSLLETERPNKPVLMLAPELAFGSPDYEPLNELIAKYPQNLIFIGGFGFTKGSVLTELALKNDIEGVWTNPLNDAKKYNGGWIWIKESSNIQCYIFLKNYLEQNDEITTPNLEVGDSILRLEGSDLVIFPLICADLISVEDDSPRKRIAKSLSLNSSSNKRTLFTGAILNEKSSSGWWKSAIGDLLESTKISNPRLLLSNCKNPPPLKEEEVDKWRCLSGGYQNLEGSKPPKSPLPNLRHVDNTKFTGLVIRTPLIGCVFAKLNWSNSPAEGKNVLSPVSQYIWNNSKLQISDGYCAADELYRYIKRHKGKFFQHVEFSNNASALVNAELDKLILQLSPISNSKLRNDAGSLYLKCLKGIIKDEAFSADDLYTEDGTLDCAITTLVLIQSAIDAELMPQGRNLGYGQLLSNDGDHEVLVWGSSKHSAQRLYIMVEEAIVKEGGSARPLIIVGRGNGFRSDPSDGRVKSNRLTDISDVSPRLINVQSDDRDICEANDRVVFWKNQGVIDDILSSSDTIQNLKDQLRSQITLTEST